MIRTLTIENFRCFEQFELHDLGRVNLLVGGNNSGKTSVLEAVELVTANGYPFALNACLARRGQISYSPELRRDTYRLDVRRLFHGHRVILGSHLRVTALTDENEKPLRFTASLVEANEDELEWLGATSDQFDHPYSFEMFWGTRPELTSRAALLSQGLVPAHKLHTSGRWTEALPRSTVFLPPDSLDSEVVTASFEKIVLTTKEDLVLDLLRVIEPKIERIATQRINGESGHGSKAEHRGGVLLRLSDSDERIPLGSMGDGVWRLLGLALCLARAENGVLLVDEIDTGLHYSVMEKMWKLVTETAKRLNIQVFATTHSRDCVESLASVCRESVTENSEVTIQRVERGKKRSVAYTEREIVIAAEHGMEVR